MSYHRKVNRGARRTVVAATAGIIGAGVAVAIALPSLAESRSSSACADLDVVFARGTGERPGLGITGGPLVAGVRNALPGVNVTGSAVDYAANVSQSSAGPGATEMTRHIVSVAAQCPDTKFAIGGYSQGASVTDIAIGIRTTLGRGESIPESLAPRIVGVVTFGNPLGLSRRTIESASPLYGPKALEACNRGDFVCGGTGTGPGFGHLSYPRDGSVTAASRFVADQFRKS
nr:cutinase family protein [uncultured bacterium]